MVLVPPAVFFNIISAQEGSPTSAMWFVGSGHRFADAGSPLLFGCRTLSVIQQLMAGHLSSFQFSTTMNLITTPGTDL
jgi:hypothetical protein